MSEKMSRKQRDYAWYKSIGICVYCHKNKADPGHVDCLACRMDRREKGDTHSAEAKERHKIYLQNLREQNRQAGVCIVCGKRQAVPGKTVCEHCKAQCRQRAEKKRREEGMIPRFMMGEERMCYFCGKPTDGEKLCPECYERCKQQMLHARNCRSGLPNLFEKTCQKDYELRQIYKR